MTARGLTMFGEYSMETASGNEINILDPMPSAISIRDIAHALSNQCRFNGHVRHFYSVAEHSVLVSHLLEELHPHDKDTQLAGLLHDAAEAYMGDMISPMKFSLAALSNRGNDDVGSFRWTWDALEGKINCEIARSLDVSDSLHLWHSDRVKQADWWALKIEATELTSSRGRGWHWPEIINGLGHNPPDWVDWAAGQPPFVASSMFLFRYSQLIGS